MDEFKRIEADVLVEAYHDELISLSTLKTELRKLGFSKFEILDFLEANIDQ